MINELLDEFEREEEHRTFIRGLSIEAILELVNQLEGIKELCFDELESRGIEIYYDEGDEDE